MKKICPTSPHISLVFLALIFVSATGAEGPQIRLYPVNQKDQTESQDAPPPANGQQQGTEDRPVVVKVLPTEKTKEEATADTEERKEKVENDRKLVDFNGQLAAGTFLLATVGVLQLLVFGYQAYKLKQTVDGAAEQSKTIEKHVTEAARLAAAAEKSTTIASDTAIRQLRAYVGIIFAKQPRPNSTPDSFHLTLINTGVTPAHLVRTSINWCFFVGKDTSWPAGHAYTEYKLDYTSIITLGAGRDVEIGGPLRSAKGAPTYLECKARADNGEITIYHYGTIRYSDEFGKPHFTNYCYKYNPGTPNSGTVCDHHNDCDYAPPPHLTV